MQMLSSDQSLDLTEKHHYCCLLLLLFLNVVINHLVILLNIFDIYYRLIDCTSYLYLLSGSVWIFSFWCNFSFYLNSSHLSEDLHTSMSLVEVTSLQARL